MKCFVDSNVFISLIQDEFGRGLEFMTHRTKEFFERVIDCLHTVVISRAVIQEISKITLLRDAEINNLFDGFEDKISIAKISPADMNVAENLDKKQRVGRMDALHLIIAKKEKCNCVVTWNKKHFLFAEEEIKVLDPREL
ncbi:MAG: type II toxin-antitoxin system VapC family toxin [Nanoarchaeota archaeon]|nr:type II toxin-antitoxin system VapC family toxin [Nanoarchaeota archaeon]